MFTVIFLFFAGSIFSNCIKLGTTPFFLFDFYSVKMPPQPSYSLYEVRYGDNRRVDIRHTWEQPRKMLLLDPLRWYVNTGLKKGGQDEFGEYLKNDWGPRHPGFRSLIPYLYDSSAQFNAFPAWYKRYLSEQAGGSVGHIYILRKTLAFDKNGYVQELASDTTAVIE